MIYTNLEDLDERIPMYSIPTLFLMVGLPYSGKSYASIFISKKYNLKRVSFDETWNKLAPTTNSITWDVVNEQILTECEKEIRTGKHVILDTYTEDNLLRENFRSWVHSLSGCYCVIYVNTDIKKILQRHKDNLISQNRHQITKTELNTRISNFIVPKLDTNSIRLII